MRERQRLVRAPVRSASTDAECENKRRSKRFLKRYLLPPFVPRREWNFDHCGLWSDAQPIDQDRCDQAAFATLLASAPRIYRRQIGACMVARRLAGAPIAFRERATISVKAASGPRSRRRRSRLCERRLGAWRTFSAAMG